MAIKRKSGAKRSAPKAAPRKVAAAKKAVTKRKRKGGKKKSKGLSEMFSPATAKMSMQTVVSGAIGGAAIRVVDKLMPATWGLQGRILGGAAASFLASAVLGMPNVAAGMSGALAFQVLEKKLLADDEDYQEAEFTDVDILEEMPDYLADDGQILLQDQNGQLQYLADMQPNYYAPYNRQY